MRILHVNDVAFVGSTLVDGLNRHGHQAELCRLQLAAARRSTAMKLLALPLRLRELAAINRKVHGGRYDIVHIHFAYLGMLGIVGRYPYLLHIHGSDVRRDLHDRRRRWLILQSIAHARSVLFSTPDLAAIVHPHRPDAVFLPNPVDTENFRPAPIAMNLPPKILLISELSPIKAVDVAFAALAELRLRFPNVEVVAINHGKERERYWGTPGVTFVERVPHNDMAALIQSCDIVLGQLGIGSIGMVELESLACGKPLVSYFAYNELYAQPSPIFSANQPTQVADYLARLLDDATLRRQAGESGREWVCQFHSLPAVIRQLEMIYEHHLNRQHG